MSSRIFRVVTLITAFFLFSNSTFSSEKGIAKSGDLLDHSPAVQSSFFTMSINMAAVIALRAKPDIAKCISVWYPEDVNTREKRHSEMLGYIKKYPDSHPSALILAAIEKKCGRYDGKKPT